MITWSYVAGFFDGEGSLHFDRYKSSVQIRMDNTCEKALVEIMKFVGCGRISNRGRAKPHHKDCFRLTIANHVDVLRLLAKMRAYLIVKRLKADLMIRYKRGRRWNNYRGRRRNNTANTRSTPSLAMVPFVRALARKEEEMGENGRQVRCNHPPPRKRGLDA